MSTERATPVGPVTSYGSERYQRVGGSLRCTDKVLPTASLTAHGDWYRAPVESFSQWAFGPEAWQIDIVEWVGHLALNGETVSPRNGK